MTGTGVGSDVPAADAGPALPTSGAPVLNPANLLTLLRLAMVPVFAVLLLSDDGSSGYRRVLATAVFALATLTDRWDGALARRYGLVTDVGKILDPIADKALVGTALVGLSVLGELPWWVTVVVLVREVGVTVLRFVVLRHGVIAASHGGKLKTVLQTLAVGLYLLPLSGVLATSRTVVLAAALVVTVATGVDYVLRAVQLRRQSPRGSRVDG